MGSPWTLNGPPLDPQWASLGPSMGAPWTLNGPPLDPQGAPLGPSMGLPWTLKGENRVAEGARKASEQVAKRLTFALGPLPFCEDALLDLSIF